MKQLCFIFIGLSATGMMVAMNREHLLYRPTYSRALPSVSDLLEQAQKKQPYTLEEPSPAREKRLGHNRYTYKEVMELSIPIEQLIIKRQWAYKMLKMSPPSRIEHANNVYKFSGGTESVGSYIVPRSSDGSCATLHGAVITHDVAVVDKFLESTCPNSKDEYGSTALHYAVCLKDYAMIRLLILAGADKNMPGDDGATPYHLADGDQKCCILEFENTRRQICEREEKERQEQEYKKQLEKLAKENEELKKQLAAKALT